MIVGEPWQIVPCVSCPAKLDIHVSRVGCLGRCNDGETCPCMKSGWVCSECKKKKHGAWPAYYNPESEQYDLCKSCQVINAMEEDQSDDRITH